MTDAPTVTSLIDSINNAGGSLLDTRGEVREGAGLADSIRSELAALRLAGVGPASLVGWPAASTAVSLLREVACLSLGAVAVPLPADQLRRPPIPLDHAIGVGAGSRASRAGSQPQFTDLANVKFSSGTTGPRKVVGATSAHVEHTWRGLNALVSLGPDDTVLAVLEPHVWLQRTLVMLALARGSRVVLLHQPRALVAALRQHRPTVVYAVPSVLGALAEVAGSSGRPLAELWGGRLRSLGTGSAACGSEVLAAYAEAGIPVHEGYGTSETGMIAKNKAGASRTGTVGRPFEGVEILIVDGEVHVRCAALPAVRYLDGTPIPGRIDATLHRTGDLGSLDDDGYLSLSGRVDDLLGLRSGRKVSPVLLEEALTLPPVRECAVFLAEGRLIVAVVSTGDLDPATVRATVNERCRNLAESTELTVVVLGAEVQLPRNGSGKLQRARLTDVLKRR